MKTKLHEKGFTLIELMVVIAVLAILAGIAAPNFQTYMAQRRLNGAARQVMSDLMKARMEAVSLNHRVKVFFYSDHQYKICDDANSDGTVDDGEGNVQIRDIHPDYHDVTLSASANPVFRPRGTAAGMCTVTLSNFRGSRKVTVAITGRVKIT